MHFNDMKEKVSGVLASYITSLGRQRRKTQAAKLDEFAHHIPDLNDIEKTQALNTRVSTEH